MPNRMAVSLKELEGAEPPQPQDETPRLQMLRKPIAANCRRIISLANLYPNGPPGSWPGSIHQHFRRRSGRDWTFGDSASGTTETLDNVKVTSHRVELPEQDLDANGHTAAFDLENSNRFLKVMRPKRLVAHGQSEIAPYPAIHQASPSGKDFLTPAMQAPGI